VYPTIQRIVAGEQDYPDQCRIGTISTEIPVQIKINGILQAVPEGKTVAEYLAEKGISPEHVVVEINRSIIRRERHASAVFKAGDEVEIIRFVGGG
jgi:sulfur carrier protein